MDDFLYEGVFKALTYRAVKVRIDDKDYSFSLKYCHFNPDPLDLRIGNRVEIECPSWLAKKMALEEKEDES